MDSPFHIGGVTGPADESPSGDDQLGRDLRELRERLERARAAVPESGRDELVAHLETAYEELRVADEEVRAQQEQIADLVRRQEVARSAHERVLALLPVPVLITDRAGQVRHCNAASAVLTGRHPARVEGKPVFTLFVPADRPALRDLLAGTRAEPLGRYGTGRVLSRSGQEVPVQVSATVDTATGSVSWLLLAASIASHDGEVSLAKGLGRLAELPTPDATRDEVVRAAVAVCHDVLGPHTEVTAHLGPIDEPELVASSGRIAQVLDGAQLTTGEGPTVTAFHQQVGVMSADALEDPRWPRWAAAVPERQHVAVVAVPIQASGTLAGVLTAYRLGSALTGSLTETVETLALTLRALLQELALREEIGRAADDLNRALTSRAVIDQAKGIVMAQKGCSPDQAFQHLVDLASTQHVKLREVAASIVHAVTPTAGE